MGMTLETSPHIEEMQSMLPDNSKSLTTLWLAPNVGPVKMEQESDNNDTVNTFELTNYEIKTTDSGSSESN